jgi:hypothetical protein
MEAHANSPSGPSDAKTCITFRVEAEGAFRVLRRRTGASTRVASALARAGLLWKDYQEEETLESAARVGNA